MTRALIRILERENGIKEPKKRYEFIRNYFYLLSFFGYSSPLFPILHLLCPSRNPYNPKALDNLVFPPCSGPSLLSVTYHSFTMYIFKRFLMTMMKVPCRLRLATLFDFLILELLILLSIRPGFFPLSIFAAPG